MTSPDAEHVLAWRGDPQEIVTARAMTPGELIRALIPPPPEWHRDALCREFDTSLWFPDKGQPAQPALDICGRCPVRPECLNTALGDITLEFGVWGGMSARARAAHRRATEARARRRRDAPGPPRSPATDVDDGEG